MPLGPGRLVRGERRLEAPRINFLNNDRACGRRCLKKFLYGRPNLRHLWWQLRVTTSWTLVLLHPRGRTTHMGSTAIALMGTLTALKLSHAVVRIVAKVLYERSRRATLVAVIGLASENATQLLVHHDQVTCDVRVIRALPDHVAGHDRTSA